MDEGKLYSIDCDDLKHGMVLSDNVCHPEHAKIVLATRGLPLTEELINGLKNIGIKEVKAHHLFAKVIFETIKYVDQMFDIIDSIAKPNDNKKETIKNLNETKILVERRVKDALDLFNPMAVSALTELNTYHSGSAFHSLNTGCNVMDLGKNLNWSEKKIVRSVMAAILHDVGKRDVAKNLLECEIKLIGEQEKDFQKHTLQGFQLLLEANQGNLNDDAMAALTHHEWYVESNEGYGGLSTFRNKLLKNDNDENVVNINDYLTQASQDQLDILQSIIIADALSLLIESSTDKERMPPIKIMIIMINNAKLGRFNPDHFLAWYMKYTDIDGEQTLLERSIGNVFSFPREIENKYFEEHTVNLRDPINILTIEELINMGIYTEVRDLGLDLERMELRGGIQKTLIDNRVSKLKKKPIITDEMLARNNIKLEKNSLKQKSIYFKINVSVRWLAYNAIKDTDIYKKLTKEYKFYDNSIIDNGGVSIARIADLIINKNSNRLVKNSKKELINEIEKLSDDYYKKIGLISKKFTLLLPAFEDRFNGDDLKKMGVFENLNESLKNKLELHKKRSVSAQFILRYLKGKSVNMSFSKSDLRNKGIIIEKKILYDMKIENVVKGGGGNKAIISFYREEEPEESIKFVIKNKKSDILIPLPENKEEWQDTIEFVEFDFSDSIKLPDFSNMTAGKHWYAREHHEDNDNRQYKYDVFISYSSKNKEVINKLAERLRGDKFKVWLDTWICKPGDQIEQNIINGLKDSRVCLLALSCHYIKSEWTKMEQNIAYFRDPYNEDKRYVPILLDDCEIPESLKNIVGIDYKQATEEGYEEIVNFLSNNQCKIW
ncbi:MAG: TIR domain-containing protein [Magnetococcus sp. DMHC-1]